MLTKSRHLFDDATRVVAGASRWQGRSGGGYWAFLGPVAEEAPGGGAGDSRWQGRTSADYWAFVGPFGGFTAATILRALIEHPERSGDPVALTVNLCAPIAEGDFALDVRLVKANRSSPHWYVELSRGGGEGATLATAIFAERRPSWSHQVAP